jgi:hypothetical protein
MPRPFLAPASGARLPPSPTLYVFAPATDVDGRPPALEVTGPNGAPLPHDLTQVSQAGAIRVFRLHVDTRSARRVHVKASFGPRDFGGPDLVGWVTVAGHYAIDGRQSRPDRSAVEIVGADEHVSRWSCSHTATQTLTPAGGASREAPAYRVTWAEADRVTSGELVLPSSPRQFFNGGKWPDAAPAPGADLALGFSSCLGETFPWSGRPVDVRVTALFADGSESAPPERAFRVRPPGTRDAPPAPDAPNAPSAAGPPPPEAAPEANARAPFDRTKAALAALASFFTSAAAGFFARGRRRP